MKCPKCQHENEKNARFCSSCGVKLNSAKAPKWLWPILILIFLAFGAVGFGLWEVYQLVQERDSVNNGPVTTESAEPVSIGTTTGKEPDRITLYI